MNDVRLNFKKVVESKYLSVENAERYRAICRFFYEQHEQYNPYLSRKDVWEFLKGYENFKDYTLDELEADLKFLSEHNNLTTIQDSSNQKTYEEFKNRRFLYQCTDYTIEIERMMLTLEQTVKNVRGSLDSDLVEKLLLEIEKLEEAELEGELGQAERIVIFNNWKELIHRFEQLNQETADYLSHINGEKMEKLMSNEAFLPFKSKFVHYLRDFIMSIQTNSIMIEKQIALIDEEKIADVINQLIKYQMDIPRIDDEVISEEELYKMYERKWNGLREWFSPYSQQNKGVRFLIQQTRSTIQKITKIAQQISERSFQNQGKTNDFLRLADIFKSIEDVNECHKMASIIFGSQSSRRIEAIPQESNIEDENVWYFEPHQVEIKEKNLNPAKEKAKGSVKRDKGKEEELRREYILNKEQEEKLLNETITDGRIVISKLGVIQPSVRKTILKMLAKSSYNPSKLNHLDDGRKYRVKKRSNETISLQSTDGVLRMPDFELVFEEAK